MKNLNQQGNVSSVAQVDQEKKIDNQIQHGLTQIQQSVKLFDDHYQQQSDSFYNQAT